MTATPQEIVAELGFGIVPEVASSAEDDGDVQTALRKGFRHVVLRGLLPQTVKETMGMLVSCEANSRCAAEIHLHALALQGVDEPVLDGLRRDRVNSWTGMMAVPHDEL